MLSDDFEILQFIFVLSVLLIIFLLYFPLYCMHLSYIMISDIWGCRV